MILTQIKRVIFLIYFVIYTLSCSKSVQIPLLKNPGSLFYNEWLNIIPYAYQKLFLSDIYQTGSFITTNKVDIVICNHVNRIDSLIFTSVIKNNTSKNMYPVIQKELVKIPVIGAFSKGCIVLERNYELDKNTITNALKKINNGLIIIFPEGTRMNEDNFKKSQKYCEKNNLKKYNNLLYPKMKGIDLIVNELYKQDKLGNVIDLTLKVKDKFKFKTGYFDYLNNVGNLYCNVNSYKINENTINDYELFKKWFLIIWDKKESYLDNYIDFEYKRLDYTMKTSTFVLNLVFFNLIIFYIKTFTNFSLFKKNNIIIN